MSTDTIERSFPKITEEGLDALRQRIGVKIGQTAEPWCHEATRDNIRHYAHGIGDDNPLWCVPEYARKTKFGDVIALHNFGAGDIVELRLAGGETTMLAFDAATVPEVDIAGGKMIVVPPEEIVVQGDDANSDSSPPPLRGRSAAKRPGGG